MLDPKKFIDTLRERGVDFFTGVPDSLLKAFCACVATGPDRHVTAANEGAAVALAAGHYLASGRPGLVYMQNSGEGNAVNPLASLTDPAVYGIPVLLLIGWRGQPGVHDEPQHAKQGRITLSLLEVMGIPYAVLAQDAALAAGQIDTALASMRETRSPYALVVEKGTFSSFPGMQEAETACMTREEAIQAVAAALGEKDVIVSTTGMASRELFEYREGTGQGHARDFLCVGSMGHASQIALGISLEQPGRRVWCLDGDGACIMHMGSLTTISGAAGSNFVHVLLNNHAHESVGGQPTAADHVDFPAVARAVGYPVVLQADSLETLRTVLGSLPGNGPVFLEIKVRKGHREDLGRPTTTPGQNMSDFMDYLKR
ncbi:MAG: phosphonopyruvate decarboxylase [Bacteroidales bacterium]|nr:phosphonopyruvate decarboxylase [Bacteroidales bacterium]